MIHTCPTNVALDCATAILLFFSVQLIIAKEVTSRPTNLVSKHILIPIYTFKNLSTIFANTS